MDAGQCGFPLVGGWAPCSPGSPGSPARSAISLPSPQGHALPSAALRPPSGASRPVGGSRRSFPALRVVPACLWPPEPRLGTGGSAPLGGTPPSHGALLPRCRPHHLSVVPSAWGPRWFPLRPPPALGLARAEAGPLSRGDPRPVPPAFQQRTTMVSCVLYIFPVFLLSVNEDSGLIACRGQRRGPPVV